MFPDKGEFCYLDFTDGGAAAVHARIEIWYCVSPGSPGNPLDRLRWNVDNVWQSSRNSCNSIVNHCARWTPRGTNRVSCQDCWTQIDSFFFFHCAIGEMCNWMLWCVVDCPMYTQPASGITASVCWIILLDVAWTGRVVRTRCALQNSGWFDNVIVSSLFAVLSSHFTVFLWAVFFSLHN